MADDDADARPDEERAPVDEGRAEDAPSPKPEPGEDAPGAESEAGSEDAPKPEPDGDAPSAESAAGSEDAPKPEPDGDAPNLESEVPSPYPEVSPREQRLAGWGCVVLLVLAAGLFWFILRLGRQQMVELDQTGVLDAGGYLSPAELDAAIQARQARQTGEEAAPAWRSDYEQAFDDALMSETPLVLFFESEAVEASQRMHGSTFANGNVRAVLREFVAVRVDTTDPQGPGAALAARFEVEAPAVVYLDPEGEPLRPPSRGVVDADALEVFLREALGNLEDGRSTAAGAADGPEAPEADGEDGETTPEGDEAAP